MSLIYLSGITAFLAAIVAWTGYQQHKLSKDKFKLDLFEKRFAVYKGIRRFLSHTLQNGLPSKDTLMELAITTQDAAFLFGPKVSNYIESIRTRALMMKTVHEKYKDLSPCDEKSRLIDKEQKIFEDLSNDLLTLNHVFMPYLKFSKWK